MDDGSTNLGRRTPVTLVLARLLAPVPAAIAAYLVFAGSSGSVAGCDGFTEFDCEGALGGRWSTWIGLPVALTGAACYAAIAIASWLAGSRNAAVDGLGWRLLELLTPLAIAAAVWFTGLQATGEAPACLYCLAIHATGVVLSGLVIAARVAAAAAAGDRPPVRLGIGQPTATPTETAVRLPPPTLGVPTALGVAGAVALVVGQIMVPPAMNVIDAASLDGDFNFAADTGATSATEQPKPPAEPTPETSESESPDAVAAEPTMRRPNGSRVVELLGGKLTIDTYKYPILGSPEAEHVILELMHYGCPSCRKFHPILDEARERYGDQLAIVVLPIPFEKECNRHLKRPSPTGVGTCRLSRLAVAVSQVAPEEFERVHAFLLEGEKPPQYTKASLFAKENLDEMLVSEAVLDPDSEKQVKQFIELYAALARGRGLKLPSQIVGDKVLEGPAASADALGDAWEQQLGIKPIEPASE